MCFAFVCKIIHSSRIQVKTQFHYTLQAIVNSALQVECFLCKTVNLELAAWDTFLLSCVHSLLNGDKTLWDDDSQVTTCISQLKNVLFVVTKPRTEGGSVWDPIEHVFSLQSLNFESPLKRQSYFMYNSIMMPFVLLLRRYNESCIAYSSSHHTELNPKLCVCSKNFNGCK